MKTSNNTDTRNTMNGKTVILRENARTVLTLKSHKFHEKLLCDGITLTRHVPANKLRFLQYIDESSADWWTKHRKLGALLLGKVAEEKGLTAIAD